MHFSRDENTDDIWVGCLLILHKVYKETIYHRKLLQSNSQSTSLLQNGMETSVIIPAFPFQILHKVSLNVNPVTVVPVTIISDITGHMYDQPI